MSLRPIKVAVQYLFGACLIAFFVTLLTFIFSFLGTIFCAALAGMMLGSFRNLRWHSLALSFLFPAVIVGMLQRSLAELSQHQIAFLGVACFGTFWLAYGAGAALKVFEPRRMPANSPGPPETTNGHSRPLPASATELALSREGERRLSLAVLQGRWLSQPAEADGRCAGKVMDIKERDLVLSLVQPGGQVTPVACGRLQMEEQQESSTLEIALGPQYRMDDSLVSI